MKLSSESPSQVFTPKYDGSIEHFRTAIARDASNNMYLHVPPSLSTTCYSLSSFYTLTLLSMCVLTIDMANKRVGTAKLLSYLHTVQTSSTSLQEKSNTLFPKYLQAFEEPHLASDTKHSWNSQTCVCTDQPAWE
jgi:hypothetical protein